MAEPNSPPVSPFPGPLSDSEVYERYRHYILQCQESRERRRERLAERLAKDVQVDQSESVKRIRAERGQRYVLTPEQFKKWWESLTQQQREEELTKYTSSVQEQLDEQKETLLEILRLRGQIT